MVFEKLKEVLSSQFEIDEERITMETDIVDDLGADSLDLVELIMALEDEYSVSVTDEAVYECRKVSEVVAFIEGLINK